MYIFKFTPCHLQKPAGQITEKPKGKPLEEKKKLFQKSSQLFTRLGLKIKLKKCKEIGVEEACENEKKGREVEQMKHVLERKDEELNTMKIAIV